MDAFAQHRSWQRGRRFGLSQLACLGRHTVTGLISTAGRQFLDWSADYRLFSRAPWTPEALFRPVARGLLTFLRPTEPLVVAMDDTLVRKTGTRIPGVAYQRDPLSPPFQVNFVRGQRFIQLSGLLPAGAAPSTARAIPLRFQHVPPVPKPKRSAPPEAWQAYRQQRRCQNLSAAGRDLVAGLREELDQRHGAADRPLVVTVDGSYTNRTVLKALPPRTTLIGRIRKDAKLYYPPSGEDQPAVGTKRQYGKRAPTPDALRQDPTVPWQHVQAYAAGKTHDFRVKTLGPVLWKPAGYHQRLHVMVIAPVGYRPRKGSKRLYRQPAYLLCTDPDLALELFLQYYLWRWDVEVNNRDAKQIVGAGEAQVWSAQSVDRQPAHAVASYAILLLAAAQAFGVDAAHWLTPPPKWRQRGSKTRLSTQELVQQVRKEVWSYALDQLDANSEGFVTPSASITKPLEFRLPLTSAVLYANTG